MLGKTYKQFKGTITENIAILYLLLKGYRPIEHSYKGGFAEVDIVAVKGQTLCLIEVKYRKKKEQAHTAIHPAQKERLQKQAQPLSAKYGLPHTRLDAVLFFGHWPFIEHVQNAWEEAVNFWKERVHQLPLAQ